TAHALRRDLHDPGRAGLGGKLSGLRHAARGRTDAVAGSGCALLGPERGVIDGAGDQLRIDRIDCRPADLVPCQPALRSSDRPGGRPAVRDLAPCREPRTSSDATLQELGLMAIPRGIVLALTSLLLTLPLSAHPAGADGRIPVVATFSVIADMLAAV